MLMPLMVVVSMGLLVVVLASPYYKAHFSNHQADAHAAWAEAEFFVLQTITTVGYGQGLTVEQRVEAAEEPDRSRLWRSFYTYSSVLMVGGTAIWAIAVGLATGLLLDARRTLQRQGMVDAPAPGGREHM